MPLISIVVATYNAQDCLARLLDSCCEQVFTDFEVRIQDGASSDQTVNIAQRYSSKLDISIRSERDSGIYDAWNRCLADVQGQWILFLGADDSFFSASSLSELVGCIAANNSANFISSCGGITSGDGEHVVKQIGRPVDGTLRRFMSLCHPGLLHHKSLFDCRKFDSSFRVAADYDFVLGSLNNLRAVHLDAVTVRIGAGGISRSRIALTLSETLKIQLRHKVLPRWQSYLEYLLAFAKAIARRFII